MRTAPLIRSDQSLIDISIPLGPTSLILPVHPPFGLAPVKQLARGHDTEVSELREGGVTILEGIRLSEVAARPYDLICLPLRLEDADGLPARAVLRPRGP